MASGTLSSTNKLSDTTFYLTFTPAAEFDSGTLCAMRMDTKAVSEQAVSSGSNGVTVVPGLNYLFYVISLDSGSDYLGASNPVVIRVPEAGDGEDFKVRWITDYDSDWTEQEFDIDETRVRIPVGFTGKRAHHMQLEFVVYGQNDRLYLKNIMMEARMHGRSIGARQDG